MKGDLSRSGVELRNLSVASYKQQNITMQSFLTSRIVQTCPFIALCVPIKMILHYQLILIMPAADI
jgi:hypothetical protein